MGAKPWANWIRPYKNKRGQAPFCSGQAIVELAVFGSILIMLLGILINYGLKYNFQQQVMQQTFRKALGLAADRYSATYILVKNRHIPNPANPFAVGSVIPVSSSASVVRDFQMYETADTADELPRIDIEIQGQESQYKTAAFRDEDNVPKADLEDDYDSDGNGTIDDDEENVSKYDYIYGSEDIAWWVKGGGGPGFGSGEEGECACAMETKIDPITGEETEYCPDSGKTYNIRIIDTCAGEIMDYDSMQKRCYRIQQAGINVPWYCDGDKPKDTLFAFADNYGYANVSDISALSDENKPSMGLQKDYTQDTTMGNTLEKTETTSGINTTDTLNWQVDTKRTIVYNDGLDTDGFSNDPGVVNIQEPEITSSVSQNKTYEWQTNF